MTDTHSISNAHTLSVVPQKRYTPIVTCHAPRAVIKRKRYAAKRIDPNTFGYRVLVKPSNIPNAGLGAFTTVDLPANIIIGCYNGILRADNPGGCYGLQLHNNAYVDANDARYADWTRYINDPYKSKYRANLRFTLNGKIATIRKVRAGQELLITYSQAGEYFEKNTCEVKRYSTRLLGPLHITS